ncbi:hypothetical protein P7K49_036630 [Saguinus oedipus]|uniref:Uncharacterized protein n=1 Tax=Saguinus oedipus TaxID=9490 RepID=A0ABQ9TLC8_SAGOE|nr:hypothetical protein P7K49_036630 [Saguinus oedipus]
MDAAERRYLIREGEIPAPFKGGKGEKKQDKKRKSDKLTSCRIHAAVLGYPSWCVTAPRWPPGKQEAPCREVGGILQPLLLEAPGRAPSRPAPPQSPGVTTL